jgi:hypothetical protein
MEFRTSITTRRWIQSDRSRRYLIVVGLLLAVEASVWSALEIRTRVLLQPHRPANRGRIAALKQIGIAQQTYGFSSNR